MMAKGTVLVVDDDLRFLQTIREVLQEDGYDVAVTVGAQAMDVAGALRPDVILLDVMMPGMNGIDVSQHLRHDPRTADIPLIAISADPELLDSPRLAVDGRLCKPFKNDDLYGLLARWLHRAGR
jgi:CheY-like chemotaxis protein